MIPKLNMYEFMNVVKISGTKMVDWSKKVEEVLHPFMKIKQLFR